MGVPREAPTEVHEHWASVPYCGDILFRFRPLRFGPAIKVKCEGWGQLCYQEAATHHAMHHIMNKRPMWWAYYDGWEAAPGTQLTERMERSGPRPADFDQRLAAYIASWNR
jgi:hypothetical protein